MSSSRIKAFPIFTASIVDLEGLVRQGEAAVARQAMLVLSKSKKKIRYNAYRVTAKPLGVDLMISNDDNKADAKVVARVIFQRVDFSCVQH